MEEQERRKCPECVNGKHPNCDKWVLDDNDQYVLCGCWPLTGPVRHG